MPMCSGRSWGTALAPASSRVWWQIRQSSLCRLVWPAAVSTSRSGAWHAVQSFQPVSGWPRTGMGLVPTLPAVVRWQPLQSALAGISMPTGDSPIGERGVALGPGVWSGVVGMTATSSAMSGTATSTRNVPITTIPRVSAAAAPQERVARQAGDHGSPPTTAGAAIVAAGAGTGAGATASWSASSSACRWRIQGNGKNRWVSLSPMSRYRSASV